MNLVALKMLAGDKRKYISIVAGLVFAALLITQQTSIFQGYAGRTGAWIRDTAVADLWVMDDQVEHVEDLKPMLENALYRVRGTEGVEWAMPVFKAYVNGILPDGTRQNIRLVGIDDSTLIGAPPEMVEGMVSDLRRDKAVLINADMPIDMNRHGFGRPLRTGDRLSMNDKEAVVVGTYRSSTEFFWEPVMYTTYSRAKFIGRDDRRPLTYILVKVRPDARVADVADRITQIAGLKALDNKAFERQTEQWVLAKTGIYVNFGITIALGFIIGVLTAGQTLYGFVLDNLRYFAALKAMGTGTATLVRMVVLQVLTVTLLGFGVGAGLAAITGRALMQVGLSFEMKWTFLLAGLVGLLVCTLLAGSLSLLRVLRLEPAVVFK